MYKYLLFFVLLVFSSCKSDESENLPKKSLSNDSSALTKEMMSKLRFTDIVLDRKAKVSAESWSAYQTIDQAVKQIKLLNYDFFLKNETGFETTFKELNANIPEAFNTQPIKARLLVLQTQLYRFKDELTFSKILKKTDVDFVKEIFTAFSNLNLQINKKIEKEEQVIIKPE